MGLFERQTHVFSFIIVVSAKRRQCMEDGGRTESSAPTENAGRHVAGDYLRQIIKIVSLDDFSCCACIVCQSVLS